MGITQSDIDALLASAGELATEADGDAPETSATVDREPAGPQPAPPASGRPPATTATPRELKRILRLSLPVAVRLADQEMPVERVLEINVGVIIEFERAFDAELDLMVGDCRIGTGQAVKVGENFGLRVTEIGNLDETIKALGGGGPGT